MRPAAAPRAWRDSSSSDRRACSSTGRGNSSSGTLFALTRSKRLVYWSSALSPLALTLARMDATDRSTASSCVASNAVRRSSLASKSASRVDSRSISATLGHRLGKGLEQRLKGVALELEGRLVDDEPRADRQDFLHFAQVVRAQGIARGNEVDDGIGKPHQRCKLHR